MTAVPMGFRIDADLSPIENAKAAWTKQRELQEAHGARSFRDALRRTFRINPDDVDIQHLDLDGSPVAAFDDELIGFVNDRLAFIEICGDCGLDYKARFFSTLTGLGRLIEASDKKSDGFVCDDCVRSRMAGKKK